MDMKSSRLLLLPVVLAAVAALAAGCGGGGSSGSVPADAVAVVGSQTITKAQFDSLLATAQGEDKAKGTPFPKVGTTQYTQLRDQAIAYLVQAAEFQQEGQKLGVSVTQKDIDARIAAFDKQYGGKKKFLAAVKSTGLTLQQVEDLQRVNLLGSKLYAKVTAAAKVSNAAAKQYYNQNKSSYTTPAQTTRSVRHILVSSKSQAEQLEKKLQNGASFAALAKKYSKDTGSAAHGGKLTAIKGQLVPQFQTVAFKLKTGQISAPVHSQYGWHIIQALGPVKNTPASVQPFSKVASSIEQNLLQTKQNALWQAWVAKLNKDFKGKIHYQTGYIPATATTSTTPTLSTATTG
jgi:foldase protein PrsA